MREFKTSKDKAFYLLTKKSSRVFRFFHEKDAKGNYTGSTLTICNLSDKMAPELNSEKIPYENQSGEGYEKLVLRNQAINIAWTSIVNRILENHKHYKSFYVVSNFAFPFGCEVLPTELYNGLENKK